MKKYLGMSIAIGIVAGLWFFTAVSFKLAPWPAYIGWSVFFWEGANWKAVGRGFPAIVLGASLGVLTFYCIGLLGDISGPSLNLLFASLMVLCLAFTMAIAQSVKLFTVASATFIGASHYFGLRGDPSMTTLSGFLTAAFVTSIGLILGIISVFLGKKFEKMLGTATE